MEPAKENHNPVTQLHKQWIITMEAYMDELQSLDSVVRTLVPSAYDVEDHLSLLGLRNRILLQKSLFAELLAEVKTMQAEATDDTVVTIGQIMANNKLRDKILKAEQTVFELKARINQLLSKAS